MLRKECKKIKAISHLITSNTPGICYLDLYHFIVNRAVRKHTPTPTLGCCYRMPFILSHLSYQVLTAVKIIAQKSFLLFRFIFLIKCSSISQSFQQDLWKVMIGCNFKSTELSFLFIIRCDRLPSTPFSCY